MRASDKDKPGVGVAVAAGVASSVLGHTVSFPLETVARRLQVCLCNIGMHILTFVMHDAYMYITSMLIRLLLCHCMQYWLLLFEMLHVIHEQALTHDELLPNRSANGSMQASSSA